jgi:hypothetical protein
MRARLTSLTEEILQILPADSIWKLNHESQHISLHKFLAELGKVTNVGDIKLVVPTTWSTAEATTEAASASWHSHAAAKTTAGTHATTAHHWSRLRESRFGLTIL